MKTNTIVFTLAAGLVLGGVTNSQAFTAQPIANATVSSTGALPFENMRWEEVKVEKLRHAYYLLEHTDRDYSGHRLEAMHSIKKAAEILGVDLAGWHEPHEEGQWESDHRMRESKRILESLLDETHGKEQEHIHEAIRHLNKALVVK